jgi:hypothetical protein
MQVWALPENHLAAVLMIMVGKDHLKVDASHP